MIRTRDQLLDHIATHCNQRSIRRALAEGTVEVYGGFITDPPSWIVYITSAFKHSWIVAVTDKGIVRVLKTVPWRLYTGGPAPLYRGDRPRHYTELRDSLRRIDAQRKDQSCTPGIEAIE